MEQDERITACLMALDIAQTAMDVLSAIQAEREGMLLHLTETPN